MSLTSIGKRARKRRKKGAVHYMHLNSKDITIGDGWVTVK